MVGYSSTIIYRIRTPSIEKMINIRDVIFNKQEVFDRDCDGFEGKLLTTDIEGLAEWTKKLALLDNNEILDPEGEVLIEDNSIEEESKENRSDTNRQSGPDPEEVQEGEAESNSQERSATDRQSDHYINAKFEILPTPPQTPPSELLTRATHTNINEKMPSAGTFTEDSSWQSAFLVGIKAAPMATV